MKKSLSVPIRLVAAALCCSSAMACAIDLPDSLSAIRPESFQGNEAVEKLVLHEGIARIGSNAFAGTGLHSIYCKDISAIDIAPDAFDDKTFFLFEMDSPELAVGCGQYAQINFSLYPPLSKFT